MGDRGQENPRLSNPRPALRGARKGRRLSWAAGLLGVRYGDGGRLVFDAG